jgi:hypothetical protein
VPESGTALKRKSGRAFFAGKTLARRSGGLRSKKFRASRSRWRAIEFLNASSRFAASWNWTRISLVALAVTGSEGILSDELVAPTSSVTAQTAQSVFLCLLHNLMVDYEAELAKGGIRNTAEEKRQEKILTGRTARVRKTGRKKPSASRGSSASPDAP